MTSLQIRQLPRDIYETLAQRAGREGRSLAQQVIVELRKMFELEDRRRIETIEKLRCKLDTGERDGFAAPESLIREDRER